MITVTKQMRTETGHRLMDYDGRCSHLHGHSYLWEVTASASALSPNGMIVDFKDLKEAMMAVIDPLDHALILRDDDPMLPALGTPSERKVKLRDWLMATNGDSPRLFLWKENPTAENMAAWAAKWLQGHLDGKQDIIEVTSVKVWETATSFAEWRIENGG